MEQTYTKRNLEDLVVSDLDTSSDGWVTVSSGGTVFSFVPDPGAASIVIGDVIRLETTQGTKVTGVMLDGEWLMRKSDQRLEEEHQQFRQDWHARQEKELEENRAKWTEREAALPEWIKCRLDNFHQRGGTVFEREGWGYELVIAELAVLYAESDGEDSASISEYAALYGTSGNQHATARLLALGRETDLSDTIAALVPLGAHPFYEVPS